MTNREKVKKALECCTEMECPDECPYKRDNLSGYCVHNLHRDAVEAYSETPTDAFFKWFCIIASGIMFGMVIGKVLWG